MPEPTLTPDTRPWYRQGWPWALIVPPASAVVGGIITFVLAVQSPNALVVDDYYKQGLAVNQQKQRLAAAETLSLQGLLRYDGKLVWLDLRGSSEPAYDQLTLQIIHSTRAELDRSVMLKRSGNTYVNELHGLEAGRWYLRLQPADLGWEVRGKITVDGPFQTLLTAHDHPNNKSSQQ